MVTRDSLNISLNDVCRTVGECLIAHEDELTCLDQAIGDGDHGFNMTRGSQAVLDAIERDDPFHSRLFISGENHDEENIGLLSADLKRLGMIVVNQIGGAAGALYGTFILTLGKSLTTSEDFIPALVAGVEAVKKRGRSDRGDKTLLDVLIPVIDLLVSGSQTGVPPDISVVAATAQQSADDTVPLQAKRGRASYLGPRSVGHLDPGARSCALAVVAICDMMRRITN
ncbi:dihydroxyacetone kinase subunit L [Hahella sp. CCB-MM4]|uniref:dihydroxyacetone kinase subunit DhaL n=1 Tax=Hahella sp. (strain CCB-MM4) TaxID=1926491 RepID=UPI000B9B5BB0|nr:dihydroxyacetone kinase subunit DhaL [Hahella sp. CCB-MM4]OZG75449.1 dihydroxyacetone kinase subunit L [Hahella sp. CCB-MM4]